MPASFHVRYLLVVADCLPIPSTTIPGCGFDDWLLVRYLLVVADVALKRAVQIG